MLEVRYPSGYTTTATAISSNGITKMDLGYIGKGLMRQSPPGGGGCGWQGVLLLLVPLLMLPRQQRRP